MDNSMYPSAGMSVLSSPTTFSLGREASSSIEDLYYFTHVISAVDGSREPEPTDTFYSYKDRVWVRRDALPAGAQLFLIVECHAPEGICTGEAACVRNAELLKEEFDRRKEEGVTIAELRQTVATLQSQITSAQNALSIVQNNLTTVTNTANTAKSTADVAKTAAATAQNTANTANTNATNAKNTANTANTTATNAQNAVNSINTSLANMPTHYVGTAAPSNSLGKNGDVYLQPI